MEVAVAGVHRACIVGQRAGVRRQRDVAESGVFRLRVGDVHRGADLDQFEELRRDVLVHADAAVAGTVVLHPAGVEAVVRLELAPEWHRGTLEGPAGGFLVEIGLFHLVAAIGVAVAAGAVEFFLVEDGEGAGRGAGAGSADADGHHEERHVAFHDVGDLLAGGDLHAHGGGVLGQLGRAVIRVVSGEAAAARSGGTGSEQGCRGCEACQCEDAEVLHEVGLQRRQFGEHPAECKPETWIPAAGANIHRSARAKRWRFRDQGEVAFQWFR